MTKNKALLIALFLILTTSKEGNSQIWTFEYKSPFNSTAFGTWDVDNSDNTIHGISVGLVEGSYKDQRTRLIQLDSNGNPISLFKAQQCEVPDQYYPFSKGHFISVSRDCQGNPKQAVNVFNAEGKMIWTKELNQEYAVNNVISSEDECTFLRQKRDSKEPEDFEIVSLSANYKLKEKRISLDDLREESYHTVIGHTQQIAKKTYLLHVQIYDVSNEYRITWLYSKIVMIRNGKIKWINDLRDILKETTGLQESDLGYMIYGRDNNARPIVLRLNKKGKETFRYNPISLSRGTYTKFYSYKERLFSIDKRINGKTIFLHEYDLNDGELLNSWSIHTKYSRMEALRIGKVDEHSLLITGMCFKQPSPKGPSEGFVMKVERPKQQRTNPLEVPIQTSVSEELVSELGGEVLSVNVFPNPTKFRVTFNVKDGELKKRTIKLVSLAGETVFSKAFVGTTIEADVSRLSPGIYFYIIVAEEGDELIKGKITKI